MKHFLIGTAFVLSATIAQAQNTQKLITGNNPKIILEILKSEGYTAELDESDPEDISIVGKLDGSEYRVYFYGCDNDNGCDSIQFSTGYNLSDGMTWESANEWNKGKRFAKLYLDEDMDPWVQMDVNLDGGVSRANMVDTIDYWRLLMSAFERHIDW